MKRTAIRCYHSVHRLTTRLGDGLRELSRRPDRGDISINTAIIWVAGTLGALAIAGTITALVAKYNGRLGGM